jgi:hypothetical protein
MRYVSLAALLCVTAAATASAQDPAETLAKRTAEVRAVEGKIQNLRVAVESKITKDAPYSGDATTESVQVLADGNRIVTKNTTRIYRDSEGRVRREQLNAAGTEVVSINITDPVSGTSYVLNPATHVAFRNGLFVTTSDAAMTLNATAAGPGTTTFVATRSPEAGVVVARTDGGAATEADLKKKLDEVKVSVAAGDGAVGVGTAVYARVPVDPKSTQREDLGQQAIEGVNASGTRTSTEIAAGAIGNEQPIKIVSEQWYSPDLQVLVLTKHADPRVGETTYRLTNIVRAEPAHSLFELPPDYTLKESMIRKEPQ